MSAKPHSSGTFDSGPGAELSTARDRLRADRARRSRLITLVVVAIAAALVGVDVFRGGGAAPTSAGPTVAAPAPSKSAKKPSGRIAGVSADDFVAASGSPAVLGTAGALLRYQVKVERGIAIKPDDFAATVDATLGDPRGWTAGNDRRFQRVGASVAADFTIFLATPATSELMCRDGGLETGQFTNCRLVGMVILNLARWMSAVPDYGASVDVYRAYAVNHEVGHQLNEPHERCPGPGKAAPVMQQQTLGLKGCVANAWPYLDGTRYHGPVASN